MTLLTECLDKYDALCARIAGSQDDVVYVETMPRFPWARIGVRGDAVMLILPSDGLETMAVHELEHIHIHPHAEFNVRDAAGDRTERVTVVATKGRDGWLVEAFFELTAMLFETGVEQTPHSVRELIDDLVALFRALTQPALRSLIGLWGELFVIYRSTNPQELVAVWHSTPRDKFDFSRGHERIEVKTTTGPRIHNFSHTQLVVPSGIRVTVASLVLNQAEDGHTCADIAQLILAQLTDDAHRRKFIEQVIRTLGEDWKKQGGEAFDIEQAKLSLKFFDARDIPKVIDPIPTQVMAVKYQSDLQAVPELKISELTPNDILTLSIR